MISNIYIGWSGKMYPFYEYNPGHGSDLLSLFILGIRIDIWFKEKNNEA